MGEFLTSRLTVFLNLASGQRTALASLFSLGNLLENVVLHQIGGVGSCCRRHVAEGLHALLLVIQDLAQANAHLRIGLRLLRLLSAGLRGLVMSQVATTCT